MEFVFRSFGFCGTCLEISSARDDVAVKESVLLETVAGTCVGYACVDSKGASSGISQVLLFSTLKEVKVFTYIRTFCVHVT